MKSFIAVSFAAAVAALPAPQADNGAKTCPSLDGAKAVSNNNQGYTLKCKTWVNEDEFLRMTTTEVGYEGCLTACDGTIGCGVAEYIATDLEQTKGSCTLYKEGAELKVGESTSWTIAVKDEVYEPCGDEGYDTTPPKNETVPAEPTEFGGIALRSGSPIHFGSINANSLAFWIGKNTTVYTPENTIPAPKVPYTTFSHSNETATLGLRTSVPGGQQVYVDQAANGALKFTQAHSAFAGTDAVTTGFTVSEGVVRFENNDFYACPQGGADTYGIFAASRLAGGNAGGSCLGFTFRSVGLGNETEAVWQYA